jgi:hypothetical protein
MGAGDPAFQIIGHQQFGYPTQVGKGAHVGANPVR